MATTLPEEPTALRILDLSPEAFICRLWSALNAEKIELTTLCFLLAAEDPETSPTVVRLAMKFSIPYQDARFECRQSPFWKMAEGKPLPTIRLTAKGTTTLNNIFARLTDEV